MVLGPIAVHPQYQRQVIGKLLIEEGHHRALTKGFEFSLLCGHPDYYPFPPMFDLDEGREDK